MLKLTNSFCRYLRLTCDRANYSRSHVQKSANLTSEGKTCVESVQNTYTPFSNTGQQLRLLASIKKKLHLKKFTNSNESKRSKQMSDSLQPSVNHISYGEQFEISTTEHDSNTNEWRNCLSESESTNMAIRQPRLVPPDFRVWEATSKKSDTRDGNTFKFRVVSYNVLAQYLLECHPYLYTDCLPHNLKWKVRAARLYEEILSLAPDILCLQEVQASHLNSFYARFEQKGYKGIFKQKTGRRHDGCAIYFKQSLFEIQDQVSVEFNQPELPILNRDNIGIMVKLVPKNSRGSPIVVATTHLLYNPKRTDVRLAQMQVFLAEIDRFAYHSNGRESGYLPIILTGDFNSTPDSAVIQLLDRGHVCAGPFRDTSDWKKIGVTDNCQHLTVYLNRQKGRTTDFSMVKIYNSDYTANSVTEGEVSPSNVSDYSDLFNSGSIGHSLKLSSVYNKLKAEGQCEATTFQDFWVTVDYIYFSRCSGLKLTERLRLPSAPECAALGRLPNDVYGSDHLALAATFQLKPLKSSL